MSAYQRTFVEPPFVATEPNEEMFCASDENSWQETHAADAATVETRKRSSAFVASFNAVVRRSGIPEACRVRKLDLNLDEIKCLLLTCMDAAQETEEKSKREDRPCGRVRRFKACAGVMEMYHKRLEMPPDLTKEEKAKWLKSKGRNWQRRFKRLHLAQCFTHLPFFVKYKGEASPEKLVAPSYVDNLTDLIADIARRARGKSGNSIQRYNKAADEALAHFRETMKPAYAPEWTLEEYTGEENAKNDAAATPKAKTIDPRASVKKAARTLVTAALEVVRESGMSEDEEIAYRLAIQTEIETLWTSRPPNSPRPKANRASLDTPSPVLVNSDMHKKDASVTAKKGSNLSHLNTPEIEKHSAKTQNTPEITPHFVADSLSEATRAVDACESVGAARFLVLHFDETKPKGAPQEAETVTADELRANLPGYLKRNETRAESLMIRPTFSCVSGAPRRVIHFDDCSLDQMESIRFVSFLQEFTSEGNGQAFVALSDELSKEEFDAVRDRFFAKLNPTGDRTSANKGSSGCTRWPGSFNKKPARRMVDGSHPRVRVVMTAPGRMISVADLERAGFLAAPKEKPKAPLVFRASTNLPSAWPDYESHLAKCGGDRSRADNSFAMAALGKGFSHHAIVSQLVALSHKAQPRKDDYAEKTVRNAASFVVESNQANSGREQATI